MVILYVNMSPQLRYYYNKARFKPKKEPTTEQIKKRAEVQKKYHLLDRIRFNRLKFYGLSSSD